MAFLARCPDCGKFQVSVLDPESAINLKCSACRGVFSPVAEPQQQDVNWALANTFAGYEYEPPRRSTDGLVVVANLPSVYPDQRPPRRIDPNRRRKKRKRSRAKNRPVIRPLPLEAPVPPPPETPVLPEPAANPTDQAAADSTAPTPQPPDPSIWTTSNSYRLPPPDTFVRPPRRKVVDEPDEFSKLDLNRVSMIALFVLVAGLLLSALTSIHFFPMALIALSAVVGVFAVRTSFNEGRRLLVPAGTLSIAVVVSMWSMITSIGSGSKGSSTDNLPPSVVSNAQVVPYPQFANEPSVRTAEWTDASKASLLLNGTRVEVIEARSQQSSFSIRIRVRPPAGIPGSSGGIDWNSQFPAVLHNGAVIRFEQKSAKLESKSVGASPSEGVVVLIEFPAALGNYELRLELAAAAWGSSGTMRFMIPRSMVRK